MWDIAPVNNKKVSWHKTDFYYLTRGEFLLFGRKLRFFRNLLFWSYICGRTRREIGSVSSRKNAPKRKIPFKRELLNKFAYQTLFQPSQLFFPPSVVAISRPWPYFLICFIFLLLCCGPNLFLLRVSTCFYKNVPSPDQGNICNRMQIWFG